MFLPADLIDCCSLDSSCFDDELNHMDLLRPNRLCTGTRGMLREEHIVMCN